jgi:hypothetical protein
LAIAVAASVLTFVGCGASRDQAVGARRGAVGHPGGGVADQRMVRDINDLGRAAAAGVTDQAIQAIYQLVTSARSLPNDREGWRGLALIRRRLPPILDRFFAAYPRTRQELSRLPMRTAGGLALKAWLLGTYESQRRQLLQFRSELASGGYAWAAVLRWSEGNVAASARFNSRLNAILEALPPTQRTAMSRAIAQHLG